MFSQGVELKNGSPCLQVEGVSVEVAYLPKFNFFFQNFEIWFSPDKIS